MRQTSTLAPSLPLFGQTSIPLAAFSVESLIAPYSILTVALRPVEPGVGRREQILRRPSLRIGGDAEARGEGDAVPVADANVECRDRLAQAFRERRRSRQVGLDEQYGELLAAETGGRGRSRAPGSAEHVGERAQHLVSDLVPEAVVDVLEVVEVGEHQPDRLAETLGATKLGVERLG